MEDEPDKEGMSTGKKVAAGAAIGVAVPAAVGVAKKLLGSDDDGGERPTRSGGRARQGARSASSKSRSAKRTGSTRRSTSSSGSGRTKEQLYNQAKRLKIEGRSSMTKAQLERAVDRAKS